MRVVIFTRASSEHGYGHFARCRVLGQALREAGVEVRLVVRGDAAARGFIAGTPWAEPVESDEEPAGEADLCIVDMYDYDDARYDRLRERFDLIAIFDDCEYRVPRNVSAVINANLHADSSRYPPGIKFFGGRDHIVVRPEFARVAREGSATSVLLCVGGSDPEDQMRRLLPLLEHVTARPIHAVYGPGFGQHDVLERWAGQPRVTSSVAVADMAPIFAGSCYAVTGAGTMLYELAAAGVPSACLSLAPNQEPLARAMAAEGAVAYLGRHDAIGDVELERRLETFDLAESSRQAMSCRARQLIDGLGPARLAAALLEWIRLRRDGRSPYSREEVRREYDQSAMLTLEHERLRWGSEAAMRNRHELALRELPFAHARTWLDAGCGTGGLQALVAQRFPQVRGVGLDLSDGLLEHARARLLPGMSFLHADFMEFREGGFDVLTCLGVLAKTSFGVADFFEQAARLMGEDGRLMLDFKHLGWSRFREPGFFPEPRHLWFTLDQVLEAARAGGAFEVEKAGGFLPDEGREVDPVESHTVFLVARRT